MPFPAPGRPDELDEELLLPCPFGIVALMVCLPLDFSFVCLFLFLLFPFGCRLLSGCLLPRCRRVLRLDPLRCLRSLIRALLLGCRCFFRCGGRRFLGSFL